MSCGKTGGIRSLPFPQKEERSNLRVVIENRMYLPSRLSIDVGGRHICILADSRQGHLNDHNDYVPGEGLTGQVGLTWQI